MSRKVEKLPKDKIPALASASVRVLTAGATVRVTEYEKEPQPPPIRKLNQDLYVYTADIRNPETGEYIHCCGDVEQYKHTENRGEDKRGVSRSLAKLRNLINANVVNPACMRWVTLTYSENMMDSERLYKDFEKFHKRFLYYLKTHDCSKPEYIAVAEPQGRGAWHMHVLYIWPDVAPFLDNNSVFNPLWGHGFTSIKAVRGDVDNLGAYFSAYLGDMSFEEFDKLSGNDKIAALKSGCAILEKEVIDASGKRIKKRILKGARLRLYPPGFNIFRASRGVKRPVEETMSREEAKRKVTGATVTFQTALQVFDETETGKRTSQNVIVKTYYNTNRRICQPEIFSFNEFLDSFTPVFVPVEKPLTAFERVSFPHFLSDEDIREIWAMRDEAADERAYIRARRVFRDDISFDDDDYLPPDW